MLATTPPATEDPGVEAPGSSSGLSSGEVAGIVFGVLAAVVLVGIIATLALRKDTRSSLGSLLHQGNTDNQNNIPVEG